MVKEAKPKTTVPDLRQRCLDLGLKDTGAKKVLEARLAWAALPEDQLRRVGNDLCLLSARTHAKEALVEVLLSEQQQGNVEIPAPDRVEEEEVAEPEPPAAAPAASEPKPKPRRALKKGLAAEAAPGSSAAEATPAETPAPADAAAPEPLRVEDLSGRWIAKDAAGGTAAISISGGVVTRNGVPIAAPLTQTAEGPRWVLPDNSEWRVTAVDTPTQTVIWTQFVCGSRVDIAWTRCEQPAEEPVADPAETVPAPVASAPAPADPVPEAVPVPAAAPAPVPASPVPVVAEVPSPAPVEPAAPAPPPPPAAPSPTEALPHATGAAPTFSFTSPYNSAPGSPAKGAPAEEEEVLPDLLAALKVSDQNRAKPAAGKAGKAGAVADLRAQCAELGLRTDGPRALLAARKAWAQLSPMELRLLVSKHGLTLPTERAAMIEQLVMKSQAGQIPLPMGCDENAPPRQEVVVPASQRGAFARATELHDTLRIYFLGKAKTDRSSCARCNQAIELGEWRVGNNRGSNGFTQWWHTSCFSTAFGRPDVPYEREAEVVGLLHDLETREGRWSLFESKLIDAKCNRFRAAKALKAGLKRKSGRKAKSKGLWDSDDEAEQVAA